MVYPAKVQIRYSTVLVIVLLLMGSVLYEVTRTESFGRQSAARTQDISLPSAQPLTAHLVRPAERPDYIGRSSVAAASVKVKQGDDETLTATGTRLAISSPAVLSSDASVRGTGWAFGTSNAGRVSSASGSGYAPGAYGMSGVGAWGGVSGVARPVTTTTAKPAKEPKPAKEAKAKTPTPKRGNGNSGGASSGGGSTDPVVATNLVAGFTTGAAAVESGAVASVQSSGTKSPASSPASTPEPMSLMLVGTGLVALYNVRRRLQ
jgi:hypothetical protein